MPHILVIGAFPESLINFRGDLIKALVGAGHRVTAMAAPASQEQIVRIKALGASFRAYPVARNSLNPVHDLRTLLALRRAYRDLRPDAVLAYTLKPVIWGGIGAIGLSGLRFHALITGLGFAFHGQGLKRKILTRLVGGLYRTALGRAQSVIFQNRDNHDMFVARGLANPAKCHVVRGSGVNLSRFKAIPVPASGLVFLMIARLLREKGLFEFVEAARLVRQQRADAVFQLLGPPDPSPDGVSLARVEQWQREGIIDYLGETGDVRPFIAACGVFVLPSYHEGMPRAVLEAMATGRPILTTDVPGCRETVEMEKNGFLVPRGDAAQLAEKFMWMIARRDQWQTMGDASLALAKDRFDVRKVNAELLRIMEL
ncbi:MAG: glycosyltransferase family 4 protein [Hyphomicrobiales bacterium]